MYFYHYQSQQINNTHSAMHLPQASYVLCPNDESRERNEYANFQAVCLYLDSVRDEISTVTLIIREEGKDEVITIEKELRRVD